MSNLNKSIPGRLAPRLACATVAATLAACQGDTPSPPAVSWEQFLAASTRHVDGREVYVVEWDLPIRSREELRAYYDEVVARPSARAEDGLGAAEQPLLVNRVGGVDDIWRGPTAGYLRYCVSTEFGARYGRAVAEMAAAGDAWARTANVRFSHVPALDGSCNDATPGVTIAMRPWTQGGARAFFPSDGRGTVWMNYPDLDNNYDDIAPAITTEGVLRHELGHVLGFRHEHTSFASGTCFEDTDWRALTEYDPGSVMHYPWCNGILTSDLSLTPRDQRGAVTAYGMAIAPLLGTLY